MAGRREIIGEAVVKLSAIDTGLQASLAAAKVSTAKTMREIGAMGATIDVDIRVKDARAKIAAARTELDGLKKSYEELGSSRDWTPVGKATLARMEELDRLINKTTRDTNELTAAIALQEAAEAKLGRTRAAQQKRYTDQHRSMMSMNRGAIEALSRLETRQTAERNAQLSTNLKLFSEIAEKEQKDGERSAAISKAKHEMAQQEIADTKLLSDLMDGMSKRSARKFMAKVDQAGGIQPFLAAEQASARAKANVAEARRLLGMPIGEGKDKKSGIWSALTNSDNIGQTFKKLMREPVRLGPFSATIKGLTVGMTALGPIITSVIGGLLAMTAAVGGALTSAMAVGLAGVVGFGQGLLGVGMIIKPFFNEFHRASLVTNAYGTAVAKYGKNSTQAAKAQTQLNNVLKGMSPVARTAYRDLSQIQTTFAKMTESARPALERAMASTMSTFKTLAPNFARNSVQATRIMSGGISDLMGRLKNDGRSKGGGGLNTMFVNANNALGPLLGGINSLIMSLSNIGASASRHLKPLTDNFKEMMDTLLGKTSDKGSLNRTIDGLVDDFKSVGGTVKSATRLVKDFLNIGRGSGRGLFDSLTKTFDRWDSFAKSSKGQGLIKEFYTAAADGFSRLGEMLSFAAQAFVITTEVTGPFIGALAKITGWFIKGASEAMKWEPLADIIRSVAFALGGLLILGKISKLITGARVALVAATTQLGLFSGAATVAATEATAAGAGATAMGAGMSTAIPPIYAVIAALGLAYGAYKLFIGIRKRAKEIHDNPSELDPRNDTSLIPAADMPKLSPAEQAAAARRARRWREKDIASASYRKPGSAPDQLKAGAGDPSQAGLGKSLNSVQQVLSKQGGRKFAYQAFVSLRTEDATTKLNVLTAAAKSKLSKAQILKILGNNHNAKQKIDELNGIKIPSKTVRINAVTNAFNVIADISSQFQNLVSTLGVGVSIPTKKKGQGAKGGMFAEGGVNYSSKYGTMGAALGYTQDTAMGNANNRPRRSAMGKFSEPTLLVGEENRPEFVIATNPAYRAQNLNYLAQAAGALGVEMAAKGRTPYGASMMADAFLSSKSINARIKHDKNRVKVLEKKMRVYDKLAKKPKRGSSRYINHQEDKVELARLKHDLRVGSRSARTVKGNSAAIAYQQSLVAQYTNAMTLAEKRGDTTLFNSSRQKKIAALENLDRKYALASIGQKGSRLSKLKADQYQIQIDLTDTKNSTIGGLVGAIGQAQMDQLNTQLTSARNEATINAMFGSTASGLSDIIASGGPRRSGRAAGMGQPVIHINTLVPSDQRTLDTINDVVVGAMSTQGSRIASGMTVG